MFFATHFIKKMVRLKKGIVPIFMFHCWLVNVLMSVCINVVLKVHDDSMEQLFKIDFSFCRFFITMRDVIWFL